MKFVSNKEYQILTAMGEQFEICYQNLETEMERSKSYKCTMDKKDKESKILRKDADKLKKKIAELEEKIKAQETLQQNKTLSKDVNTPYSVADKVVKVIPCIDNSSAKRLLNYAGSLTERERMEYLLTQLFVYLENNTLTDWFDEGYGSLTFTIKNLIADYQEVPSYEGLYISFSLIEGMHMDKGLYDEAVLKTVIYPDIEEKIKGYAVKYKSEYPYKLLTV